MIQSLLIFTISVHASQFDFEKYVHLKFIPSSIRDVSPLPKGGKIDLSETKFEIVLDVFTAPGMPAYPTLVFGYFNVRRQNHQWIRVPLHHTVFGRKSGSEMNLLQTQAADTGALFTQTDYILPPKFPDEYSVFVFDSGKISRPEFVAHLLSLYVADDLGKLGSEGHLQGLIAVPGDSSTRHSFPMIAELIYSQIEQDPQGSVASWKRYEGTAVRKPLSVEQREKLEALLNLETCGANLRPQ